MVPCTDHLEGWEECVEEGKGGWGKEEEGHRVIRGARLGVCETSYRQGMAKSTISGSRTTPVSYTSTPH